MSYDPNEYNDWEGQEVEIPQRKRMKIFIGGLLAARQDRFRQLYPDIEFLFASDQERPQRWLTRAQRADVAIIDQARCSHKLVNLLKAHGVQCHLADGNLQIGLLIERMCDVDTPATR